MKKSIICIFLGLVFTASAPAAELVRAAFDLGSSSTKFQIARVDTTTGEILEDLTPSHIDRRWDTGMNHDLAASDNNSFSKDAITRQWSILRHLKEIAVVYGAEEFSGVATAAFRSASNGAAFLALVTEKLGIHIHLISQEEEGTLGMTTVAAKTQQPIEGLTVWDQGGGSFQISTTLGTDSYVYQAPLGVHSVNKALYTLILGIPYEKREDVAPSIKPKHVTLLLRHLRGALPEKPEWMETMQDEVEQTVIGIGASGMSVFSLVCELTGSDGFTRNDVALALTEAIQRAATDDLQDVDEPELVIAKLALVLAVMDKLNIDSAVYEPVDDGATSGILATQRYWTPAPKTQELLLDRPNYRRSLSIANFK